MSIATISNFDAELKDVYAAPGARLKQWVVALRADQEWEREACPYVERIPEHEDDGGAICSNRGRVQWRVLDDHACQYCHDWATWTEERTDIAAFLRESVDRCKQRETIDLSLLSDEVQPDLSLGENPMLAFLRRCP